MKKFVIGVVTLVLFLTGMVQISSAIVLEDIENESPGVWGISINNNYVPEKGGIKVCKAENNVIVGFYLSEENLNFYRQTFPDGRRKPIGFEMEIKDRSGVFNRNDLVSITTNSFSSSLVYVDNYQLDGGDNYTLAINNPSELEANKWYTVTFHFNKHVDVSLATYEVQVQLVGDVRKLRTDFGDIYENYGFIVKSKFEGWFAIMGDSDGNNFFNIRQPRGSIFYRDKFFGWPESTETGYDRFLWVMHVPPESVIKEDQIGDYKPYSCGFGSDPWDNSASNVYGQDLEGDCGSLGPGFQTLPLMTENPNFGLPDFVVKKTWFETTDSHEQYIFAKTDEIKIRMDFKNVGDDDVPAGENVEARIYLSDGYKVDRSDNWIFIDKEFSQTADLDPGETDSQTSFMRLWEYPSIVPGKVYNVVACIDRIQNEGNGIGKYPEKYENNNCSTEAVFAISIPNYAPTGHIDSVNCTSIQGWAKDSNTENPIDVHVYKGDALGNNKVIQTSFSAGGYRSDVGNHAFSWIIPDSLKTGTVLTLFFYGIDSADGDNPLIGQTTITCAAPIVKPAKPTGLRALIR